ncbi:MAG: hypothetical protein J6R79_02265 [Bacteroidaceae bacterium]|nr:hypothetical protein [Bacteroidaceae bacterium]
MTSQNTSDVYLSAFEQRLEQQLLRELNAKGVMGSQLLNAEDIDQKFETFLQEYVADAVPQIVDYPMVSIAWAAYLGMGLAQLWDADFDRFTAVPYPSFYGPRGFDDMDENILFNILGVEANSNEAHRWEKLIQSVSQSCLTAIRAEQIEPQSPMAFHVFVRTVKVAARIGAALWLTKLGYKYEKVEM